MIKGIWNMAPDRNWDGGSGELLLRAKATSNYAAYVTATETIARIKVWALARQLGQEMPYGLDSDGYWLLPAKAVYLLATKDVEVEDLARPELAARYQDLARRYQQVFAGRLPVVTLKLQTLNIEDLPAKGLEPNYNGLKTKAGHGPFITGMTLGKIYDTESDPEWSFFDFTLWRQPSVSSGSAKAQAELNAVSELSYWRPRLQAEGMGSASDLAQVKTILDHLREHHVKDKRAARVDGHHVYNFDANSFNPLRQDLDAYNPHGR
jgi:hypothetical protein